MFEYLIPLSSAEIFCLVMLYWGGMHGWDTDVMHLAQSVCTVSRNSFADKIFYGAVPEFRITCSTRHDLFRREEF